MGFYPEPEKLSDDQLIKVLKELKHLLGILPVDLPLKSDSESRYAQFLNFQLDADVFEKTGCEVSTLSEQLKSVFGYDTRSKGDGIVNITERGPAVCAIHTVFVTFLLQHPHNNVLRKWIVDVANGARKVHEKYKTPVPPLFEVFLNNSTDTASSEASGSAAKRSRSDTLELMLPQPKSVKAHENSKPSQTAKSTPPAPTRTLSTAGRKRDELLAKLAIPGVDEHEKNFWTCIATSCGHRQAGNMSRSRILAHSVKCPHLEEFDSNAKREALDASVENSLGNQLKLQQQPLETTSSSTQPAQPVPQGSGSGIRQHVTNDGKLNLKPLQQAGREQKAKSAAEFKCKVDHIILRLICIRGLVPNILDSPEWKELMTTLSGLYEPSSSTMFRDKYIPQEAAYVRSKQEKLLADEEDPATLTFDGTTIRALASFYTAHATTSDRRSFLLDGHEGSGEHHNKDWIVTRLLKTINNVGASRWAASVSDNTNVTKAARQGISDEYPHILPVWDCVHHIQNTIKDITNLSAFKSVMSTMKSIVRHFSKSSFGVAKLIEQRHYEAGNNMEKVLRLQKVGKTRFGTHWTACVALEPCLPAIRSLVSGKIIKFKNTHVQSLFANRTSDKYQKFETGLLQYTTIVAPLIRSLWSLEAAHANAADVFIFWLAVAATLKNLFEQGPESTGIPISLANEIITVYNKRYTEFFKNDFYFVGFLLDPRYPNAQFLKDTAQLSRLSVIIPSQEDRLAGTRPKNIKYPQAFKRFSDYCRDTLIDMLKQVRDAPLDAPLGYLSCLRGECPRACAKALKEQLEMYWSGDFPFEAPPTNDVDPLEWWKLRKHNRNAKILALIAIKIFSILVNSMPDERTNSMITWFNSPTRGNQSASTIVDMIQIGQWYGKHDNPQAKPSRYRPVVKFRKIDKETLEKLQNGLTDSSVSGKDGTTAMAEEPSDAASGNTLDSSDDESEDPLRVTPPTEASLPADADEQLLEFDVDIDINSNSPSLADMIAEKPEVAESNHGAQAKAVPEVPKHVYTVEDAFEDWA